MQQVEPAAPLPFPRAPAVYRQETLGEAFTFTGPPFQARATQAIGLAFTLFPALIFLH